MNVTGVSRVQFQVGCAQLGGDGEAIVRLWLWLWLRVLWRSVGGEWGQGKGGHQYQCTETKSYVFTSSVVNHTVPPGPLASTRPTQVEVRTCRQIFTDTRTVCV